jgi:para-aminobenzoate synthetase component I
MIREIPFSIDLARQRLAAAPMTDQLWLDSAGAADDPLSRYSFVAEHVAATLEQPLAGPAVLRVGGGVVAEHASAWELWRQVHQDLPRVDRGPGSSGLGWIGYAGFESARHLERLPATAVPPLGLPTARWALVDAGVLVDHHARQAWALAEPELTAGLSGLDSPHDALPPAEPAASPGRPDLCAPTLHPTMDRAAYEAMVARTLEYIAAGDIYQANLAQCFKVRGVVDPLAAYLRLRELNRPRFGAFFRWGEQAVLSSSPELMLQLDGAIVRTAPIKGTRPRTGDPAADKAAAQELLASAKERAELTMIVDLHRNDLGRVCQPGTVRVVAPRRLEHHPTVLHTVADVVGQLRPEHDAITTLAASFPAGSISGVPKIRALEIIDELEPVGRGVYTGAIGHVGLDGRATLSVAIRIAQWQGGTAAIHVGGGIVADSTPAAEYAETLAKGAALFHALARVETTTAPAAPVSPFRA